MVDLQRSADDLFVMTISSGFVAAGFGPVREAFERNFEDGLELGAGFAAYVGDELVVDLQGGQTDRKGEKAWDARTLCPVFSTTKPIAALTVAMLVEQGKIDYDKPLADYWPEFAAEGKGVFTVAEALSHQAGVPGFPDPIDPDLWLDPPALSAALAKLKPMWGKGEGSGYHPLTWGYIAGELVRRVEGRTLGAMLREDVSTPLDIDFFIGTPESEHSRCAQMMKPKEPTRFGPMNPALKAAFLTPWSAPTRGGPDWRKAEIPSANGHGTAGAVARLFSAYAHKGRIGETRLFSADTWEQLTRERVEGEDRILPGRVSLAAGVMRNTSFIYGPNPNTLWHSGWGGSGGFGDPDLGVSAAYVMNRQGSHLLEDDRRSRIINALYSCL
ncbi:MAG TPA: serine hydrolase domain-containing protein [Hyphomonadaceae bacterium]|nr:serine hydrolase domain-containing protein [Hyphomonadaceae bacterium]